MKKIIKILLITSVIVFCMSFLSCGKKDDERGEEESVLINVGFSQLGAESDWRVANTESITGSLSRENGFELMFDDAQQKQDKQFIAIRNFTQQEVDCIVLAPVTETGWDTVLTEAKNAKIPVVVVDRRVKVNDENLITAWVGSDFAKEAKIACEWLKEYTEKKGIKGEELKIVDIQGTLGATAQIGRTNGLKAACDNYGWQLLAAEPADYTRLKGKEVMQELLKKFPEVNVVYCENDNEAAGAIEAIEEAGKKPGTDIQNGEILIISFDAAKTGLELVLQGKIALDVECNPLQGDEVAKIIKAVKNGEKFQKYTYVIEKAFSLEKDIENVTIGDNSYAIEYLTPEIMAEREY